MPDFNVDEQKNIMHDVLGRLYIPFVTISTAQLFAGAFCAVKADTQANPNLGIVNAFRNRFAMNNSANHFVPGMINIYRGSGWNYIYTLGCSALGNNLSQKTRTFSQSYTDNQWTQAFMSGWTAGIAESSITTNIVTRELAKTTGSTRPNFYVAYRTIFPSLLLRDSIGWITVQRGTGYIEEREKLQSTSTQEKIFTCIAFGMLASILSAPADANLRRVFSETEGRTARKIFSNAVKTHGLFPTLRAGLVPRVACVFPHFIGYGVTQLWLNQHTKEKNIPCGLASSRETRVKAP